jgi:hypothetical protein
MISQYFMESLPFSSPDEFPTPRNVSACFSGGRLFRTARARDTCDESNPQIVPDVLQLRPVDVNIPQIPVDFPFCSTRTSAPPGGTLGPFTWGPFLRRHGGIQKCYVVFLRDDCGDTRADDDENWYSND